MGDRRAKDALYEGFAEVAKTLANGHRAELIDVLIQGERHVEELAGEIGQSVANTSFHLRALAGAGLVTTRRDGTRVYYRVAGPQVIELWLAVRGVATAHHERITTLAAAYLGAREQLAEIGRDELVARLATGDVIVIDVRPDAEYAAGHIPGARSIPIERLADQLGLLPPDVDVVAYCRGPYCVMADDAVRLLQAQGRSAARLTDGYPEWRLSGLPIDTTPPASPRCPQGSMSTSDAPSGK